TSLNTGASAAIAFESLPSLTEGDAVPAIFGIPPRVYTGAAENKAQIVGSVDLSAGADVRTRPLLSVTVDQRSPITIDLDNASGPRHLDMSDLVAAINKALGGEIASADGPHLILTSPTAGSASRIAVQPATIRRTRSFVTRAEVLGEAAEIIFGSS